MDPAAHFSFMRTAIAVAQTARLWWLFLPDPRMQGFSLVLEQGAEYLGGALATLKYLAAGQIERRVFRVIAGDAAQPMFAQAIDQPANSRPIDRARAHRAGFGGRIERRTFEHLRAERRAGLRRQQALGVRGAVTRRHVTVLGFDQDVAVVIDQDGAERMVAMADGAPGDVE